MIHNQPILMDKSPRSKRPLDGSGIEIRHTICAICSPFSHCVIDAYVKIGIVLKVEGNKNHPHNGGTLRAKGAAGGEYVYNKDRIRTL